MLRLTCSFKRPVVTPYSIAKSLSNITCTPRMVNIICSIVETTGRLSQFAITLLLFATPFGTKKSLTSLSDKPVRLALAERQGFEPWDQQAGQRFSRPPRSTTPASLLGSLPLSENGCKSTNKNPHGQIFVVKNRQYIYQVVGIKQNRRTDDLVCCSL